MKSEGASAQDENLEEQLSLATQRLPRPMQHNIHDIRVLWEYLSYETRIELLENIRKMPGMGGFRLMELALLFTKRDGVWVCNF